MLVVAPVLALITAKVLFRVYCIVHAKFFPFKESALPWAPLKVEKTKRRRVLIVGGGLSGIQSLKTAVANGYEPILLEKREKVGGLWKFLDNADENEPTVYNSTHIDTGYALFITIQHLTLCC